MVLSFLQVMYLILYIIAQEEFDSILDVSVLPCISRLKCFSAILIGYY